MIECSQIEKPPIVPIANICCPALLNADTEAVPIMDLPAKTAAAAKKPITIPVEASGEPEPALQKTFVLMKLNRQFITY